jgi:hypothetical protein
MNPQLTKRALLRKGPLSAGVGLGTLALLTQSASSDTPFTAFAFPVTGAPTPRTLPDRLAEVVNVKDFGAVGDGTHDDTTNIQAAIDYAISHHRYTVHMPEGNYKTTDTIHLGYGTGFTCVELVGTNNWAIATSPDFEGFTRIKPAFKDRPVINIQGARGSAVRRIAIEGPGGIIDNFSASLATRANPAAYVPSGTKDDPKAPFCGICVDGYAGGTPANPYPTPNYPAWTLPVKTAYGKAPSSDLIIERCGVTNCLIGYMIQPNFTDGLGDGNGDYIKIKDCGAAFQKIGICWGNSQARSTDVQNFAGGFMHTVFQGNGYGHACGNMAGNWSNISLIGCYRIISQAQGWSHPILISDMYQEAGNIIGDGAGLEFHCCSFQYFADARYSGGTLIEVRRDPMFSGDAKFVNCSFSGRSAFHFNGDCRFEACSFSPFTLTASDTKVIAANSVSMQKCLDAFGQVFISGAHTMPGPWLTRRNLIYGIGPGHAAHGVYAKCYGYDGESSVNMYGIGMEANETSKGLFIDYDYPGPSRFGFIPYMANVSLTGHTLTFNGYAAGLYQPGDALYCASGVWWYVDNQSSSPPYTVTAYALTDVTWDGATWTIMNADPTSGNWYLWPINVLDLDPYDADASNGLFMQTTQGKDTINFVNAAGNAANRPTRCTVNSRPLWFGKNHQITGNTVPFPQNTIPIATPSATSLQMSAAALVTGTWLYCPGIKRIK